MAMEDMKSRIFEGEPVYIYVQKLLFEYPGLAENLKIKSYVQAHVEGLALQMTSWCVAGRIPSRSESQSVSYPDGVWQTFKSKFMPHWFKERFPVREVTVTVEKTIHHYFVCPHLVTKPREYHIQFMATGSPLASQIYPDER